MKPMELYVVLLLLFASLFLAGIVFDTTVVTAKVTARDVYYDKPTQIKDCGNFCGTSTNSIQILAIDPENPANYKCVSIDEYVNSRYCCSQLECPVGSSCISGICR